MRLIDADKLKTELDAWARIIQKPNHYARVDALYIIDCALTIDAVPVVRGEWKQGKEFSAYPRVPFISTAYYCSNCEEEAYWDTDYGQQLFDFCPNCGAKMEDKPCG